MTQSNTIQARTGERPTCWNRPDYPELVEVQRGLEPVVFDMLNGMTATVFVPAFDLVRNPMTKHCASWSVAAHENPAADSVPALESWRCYGCRHLPQDPRVIARAKQLETAA
jgi:hypothetical protein